MADQSHLEFLTRGAEAWNSWRAENRSIRPDLSEADLPEADLSGADLSEADFTYAILNEANLSRANLYETELPLLLSWANLSGVVLRGKDLSFVNLSGANLSRVDLSGANLGSAMLSEANLSSAILYETKLPQNLSGANFTGADLSGVDLRNTDLSGASLSRVDLSWADLSWADLSDADLTYCRLVSTILEGTTLTGCRIYGISAWSLNLKGAKQKDLIVTPEDEPIITADDLEVAQFIYLLINNEKIRNVIETMTSKAVLILGNFSKTRKIVLEEIREQLREHENRYLPILFDFERPKDQHFIETVTTVARLARFVIADITQPKAVQDELREIVAKGAIMPIQPLIRGSQRPYSAFGSLRMNRKWILELQRYKNTQDLVASFDEKVVAPAEAMFKELEIERLKVLEET